MNLVQLAETLYVNLELVTSVRPHETKTGVSCLVLGADVIEFAASVTDVIRLISKPEQKVDPLFSMLTEGSVEHAGT